MFLAVLWQLAKRRKCVCKCITVFATCFTLLGAELSVPTLRLNAQLPEPTSRIYLPFTSANEKNLSGSIDELESRLSNATPTVMPTVMPSASPTMTPTATVVATLVVKTPVVTMPVAMPTVVMPTVAAPTATPLPTQEMMGTATAAATSTSTATVVATQTAEPSATTAVTVESPTVESPMVEPPVTATAVMPTVEPSATATPVVETPVVETRTAEMSTVDPTATVIPTDAPPLFEVPASATPTAAATTKETAIVNSVPTSTSVPTATSADTPADTPTATNVPKPMVRVTQYSAYDSVTEDANAPVVFRIERVGDSSQDVDVAFAIDGSSSAESASVNADELVIKAADGTPLTDQVTIPAGRDAVTISVEAKSDSTVEVPEIGHLRIRSGGHYNVDSGRSRARFTVRDKRSELTNDSKLIVATLAAQNGANTTATGIATVRLYNDNEMATVNVSFSGLTSPEIAAHIHEATTGNIVLSLPLGQVNDREWTIEAADPLLTNQEVLDALLSGGLYLNVHSRDYPNGEISGTLLQTSGSIEMPTPQDADPIEALTGTELRQDIVRFLTQATFGATPETVADLEARIAAKGGDRIAAYSEWLDEQMQMDSPSLYDFYNAYRPMYKALDPAGDEKIGYIKKGITEGWFTSAVYGKAQLRDRVGFALSEIFVVSLADKSIAKGAAGMASYYDMLRGNAFGPYETLLTDVSTHPAMGWYLSHFQNKAEQFNDLGEVTTSPDENYAREIMQLFSIGLVEMHPDGSLRLGRDGLPSRTYSQTDITELARVFTGWGMSVYNPDGGTTNTVAENNKFTFGRHNSFKPYHPYWATPMKMFEDSGHDPNHRRYVLYHDKGEKTVLGSTIPAGLSGEEDLARVMSLLSNNPNTAPFISYRLIQRLVTSNPSAGYLYRVSTTFDQTNGDLGAVVKVILLDPEARNLSFRAWDGYGKQKEPLVHFTAMLRLLQAHSNVAETHPLTKLIDYGLPSSHTAQYEDDVQLLILQSDTIQNHLEQAPLRAPTVFNWFLPTYSPIGSLAGSGLVAPELQVATENRVVNFYNVFYALLLTDGYKGGKPQATLSNVRTTYTPTATQWLRDPYMVVMDSNADGQLTDADAAFDDPAAVRTATKTIVDNLDLYLCGGRLQTNSPDIVASNGASADSYTTLIDGLVDIMAYEDHRTPEEAITARDERIREALFLIGTAPVCLVQR